MNHCSTTITVGTVLAPAVFSWATPVLSGAQFAPDANKKIAPTNEIKNLKLGGN
jgi:hypothetical protein